MYSVVLAAMLTAGPAVAPAWGHGCCGGYNAFSSCCGGYSYSCCGGCCGGLSSCCGGCYGCCGGYSSCFGCCGYSSFSSYYGCCGGWHSSYYSGCGGGCWASCCGGWHPVYSGGCCGGCCGGGIAAPATTAPAPEMPKLAAPKKDVARRAGVGARQSSIGRPYHRQRRCRRTHEGRAGLRHAGPGGGPNLFVRVPSGSDP